MLWGSNGVKNSPGSHTVAPYTISAAVAERSSFTAVQIPSRAGTVEHRSTKLDLAVLLEQLSTNDRTFQPSHLTVGDTQWYVTSSSKQSHEMVPESWLELVPTIGTNYWGDSKLWDTSMQKSFSYRSCCDKCEGYCFRPSGVVIHMWVSIGVLLKVVVHQRSWCRHNQTRRWECGINTLLKMGCKITPYSGCSRTPTPLWVFDYTTGVFVNTSLNMS